MLDTAQRFLDICQPFGYALFACSVILLADIFYLLLFSRSGSFLRRLSATLDSAPARGEDPTPALEKLCATSASALANEARYVLKHKDNPNLSKLTEARLRQYIDTQRAGMSIINIITSIAPMLGILGTAWGLVKIFGVFGGSQAEADITMGISTALYTTIFGLAIAVPGVIAHTCFERRLERRAAQINRVFTELLSCYGK